MSRIGWLGGAAAIALGIGAVATVWLISRPLALLVVAIAVAAALAPIVASLDRHMPRTFSVVLVYAAMAAVVGGFAWLVLPGLVRELGDLIQRVPEMLVTIRSRLGRLMPDGPAIQSAGATTLEQIARAVALAPGRIFSGVFELLIVMFLSLYFLVTGPGLLRFIISLFPTRRRRRACRVIDEMVKGMGGYLRGAAISGAILGGLTWVALLIIGIEYAIPLAVLMAVGELVPFLGPLLAAIPAVVVALMHSPAQATTVVIVYVVLQQIENNLIAPNIMHRQTHVPPALVLFALAAGFAAGGILGALAAIPLAAAARVLVLRVAAPAIRHAGRTNTAERGTTH